LALWAVSHRGFFVEGAVFCEHRFRALRQALVDRALSELQRSFPSASRELEVLKRFGRFRAQTASDELTQRKVDLFVLKDVSRTECGALVVPPRARAVHHGHESEIHDTRAEHHFAVASTMGRDDDARCGGARYAGARRRPDLTGD
jgi:hypothetical protein